MDGLPKSGRHRADAGLLVGQQRRQRVPVRPTSGLSCRTSRAARRGASESPDDDLTAGPAEGPRRISTVVAPTTLLTALLLYFGRMHATGLFRYLGVQYSVLDLTAQDYLVRSADGMIPPLVVVAGTTVIALWIREGWSGRCRRTPAPSRPRPDRILAVRPRSGGAGDRRHGAERGGVPQFSRGPGTRSGDRCAAARLRGPPRPFAAADASVPWIGRLDGRVGCPCSPW